MDRDDRIQVFFQTGVAVGIVIGVLVSGIVRIQTGLLFPGVRHSVLIGILRWWQCAQLWPAMVRLGGSITSGDASAMVPDRVNTIVRVPRAD